VDGQVISKYGIEEIDVETYDDKGITRVEVVVDSIKRFYDTKQDTIHRFFWDYSLFSEGSHHKIFALGYDADGHCTRTKEANIVIYRFTPSNLNARLLTDSTIELTWRDNSNYETRFEIEQAGSDSKYTIIATLDSNTTSYIVKGNYFPDQVYKFRVRAFLNSNSSWYSNEATATLFLFAPTNLTVKFENDTTAVFNWKDNSFYEDSFEIEMSTDYGSFVNVQTVAKNSQSAIVNEIYLLSKNYRFQIRAKTNSFYSGYTNTFSLQLQFPAPTDLAIQQVTETSIKLDWKDNSTYEEGFLIQRATGTGILTEIARVPKNVTSFINADLDVTKNYKYIVFALSKHNASNDVTVKTAFIPTFLLSNTIIPGAGSLPEVATSPDGNIIAIQGYSGNEHLINLYRTSDGLFLRSTTTIDSIPSFGFGMNKIEFSTDSKIVTALTGAPWVYLWNVNDGSLIRKIFTTRGYADLKFSPDLKTIIGTGGSSLYFWNYVNGIFDKSIVTQFSYPSLAFSSDGNYFATGSECCLSLWDANSKTISKSLSSNTPTRYLHFTKNNERIISTGNGLISIWNIASGLLEKQFGTDAYYSDVTLSGDEKYAFTCTGSSILCYGIEAGELLNEIPVKNGIYSLFITADGLTAIGKSFDRISIMGIKNMWQKLR
jgi:hypothetical protein